MAAELIGTTVGVVGFLGQLFDGCVKAYGYFTTAKDLDSHSQRLLCKVRIEEMRLVVWGREWGVAEGKFDAHLQSNRNPQLRLLATQILEELHSTVTDFASLKEKYGLLDDVGNANGSGAGVPEGKGHGGKSSPSPSRKGSKDSDRKTGSSKSLPSTERGWRKEISLRTKWVIGGESALP